MVIFGKDGSIGIERTARILCAVLMLSLGFGHKPILAAPVAAFGEAYRLPDGSFAEICSEHLAQTQLPHSKHSRDAILFCEACLLASSILLPTPVAEQGMGTDPASIENTLRQYHTIITPSAPRTNRARDPPTSFV